MDTDRQEFENFKGPENWEDWKFNIKITLLDKDLWEYVNEDRKASNKADYSSKSAKALPTIGPAMATNCQRLIRSCNTDREAWICLKDQVEVRDPATQLARRQAFYLLRQGATEAVSDWITRVIEEAHVCDNIGISIDNTEQASVILSGLDTRHRETGRALITNASLTGTTLRLSNVKRALTNMDAADSIGTKLSSPTALWPKPSTPGPGNAAERTQSKRKDRQPKDKSKFCSHHKSHCHNTDECRVLNGQQNGRSNKDTHP